MRKLLLVAGLVAATAIPAIAAAQTSCEQHQANRKVTGTVLGAIAGGLLGNVVSGGGKAGGTAIGAVGGAGGRQPDGPPKQRMRRQQQL